MLVSVTMILIEKMFQSRFYKMTKNVVEVEEYQNSEREKNKFEEYLDCSEKHFLEEQIQELTLIEQSINSLLNENSCI